jgi:carboxyl-terminal processing protease
MHTARIAKDQEFQWWSEDVAEFREERAKKSVSLNEAERRAERDRDEAKRKLRQELRTQLGLAIDPLAEESIDDGLASSERDIAKDAAREKLAEQRPDPLLRESAAILADAVQLLNGDKKLSAQVLPQAAKPGHWAD